MYDLYVQGNIAMLKFRIEVSSVRNILHYCIKNWCCIFSCLCRVAYRENELRKRQDEKRLLQQRMSEEQEEKERRLEKLREQVNGNKPFIV